MNKINYNILKRIKKESHETEHKAKISIYISCFFVFLFFGIFYYSIEKNKKTNLNNELENNQNKNYETINDIIHKKSNIYIKNLIAENELTFRGNKKERQLELNKIYYGFVYLNYVTLLNEEIFNNKKMLELSLPTTEMLYDTNITNIKNINSEYIHKLEEIIIWIESKNFV
jgi:hypothetical protein